MRSDGGSLEGAERLAHIAVDLGAHAVVCCSTPAASARIAQIAAAAGVTLLSPTGEPDRVGGVEGWQFLLSPGEATALQAIVRDAYARDLTALGLLTLQGSFGDAVRARLESYLGAPGLRIVGDARYPPNATVLTPEALFVATRVPDAIVVWGLRADSGLAVEGLRARGWNGPVYLRPALLAPLAGGAPPGLSGDVRVPVSPASLPDAVQPEDPRASWLFDARTLGDGRLESRPFQADGATMHDALTLLARAFEQVATYGVDHSDVRSVRIATRDALIGLAPARLAAGTYDLSMDDRAAALADGLVTALFEDGRLRPLR